MKKIPVGKKEYALVDDSDYEKLSGYKWSFSDSYAVNWTWKDSKNGRIKMEHVILGKPGKGMVIDHINGNRLDNQRSNLRVCTRAENNKNRGMNSNNTSGYKGVYWNDIGKKWQVFICINQKPTHMGLFKTKKEAALAYNEAAKEHYGEFARLNVITD